MSGNFEQDIQQYVPDEATSVVVYCMDGDCDASPEAAARMEEPGYERVYDYEAGKVDWKEAGLPVEWYCHADDCCSRGVNRSTSIEICFRESVQNSPVSHTRTGKEKIDMSITLPDLPYALDALEPHMSETTLKFHHGKHHKAYVDKTNKLIKGTEHEKESLETIIRKAAQNSVHSGLFNNAAQVWNHTFFWHCMKPGGGGVPGGDVAKALKRDFGGLPAFRTAFVEAATGLFGSGWAWVVLKDGKCEIVTTANAGNPLVSGAPPLLTCDVWEHAYYLDYQNARGTFVETFLDHLVNWDFVNQRMTEARSNAERDAA